MHRIALLSLLIACGSVGPKFTGTVEVADARLLPVNPDVKTLADADQPIFVARGSYWLFHDGRWFRGPSAAGPWTHDAKPPVPVRQIDQPFAYVHYKETRQGKEIETVAQRPDAPANDEGVENRPARDRQPTATDPSVDPTLNMFPR